MSEVRKLEAPEYSSTESRAWIARIVIAVVLGEAIWGLVVSVVNGIALPAVAKLIAGDPRSFPYVGKRDLNFPALFASLLELGLALIVAVVVNSWSHKPKEKTIKPLLVPKSKTISPTAITALPTNASSVSTSVADGTDVPAKTASDSSPGQQLPQRPKPATPKKQKAVYYNIVGEPLDSDD